MKKPKFSDSRIFDGLVKLADTCEPWLPLWLVWALFVPFVLAVILGCCLEFAVRFAITPTKYYRQ
jgi:hypothetical protein